MQITDVYVQSGAAEWAKKAASQDSTHAEKKESASKSGKSASYSVSISKDASKSDSSAALVKARANALPEIREEKIAVAQERMANGYYNTPEFSRELAGRLVE